MRNPAHPRHTLGKSYHGIFPVECRPGLMQGITHITMKEPVTASELAGFELIPVGETLTFDKPRSIEVLEFGGYVAKGKRISQLIPHQVMLEQGAVLTGPLAWRPSEDPVPPKREPARGRGSKIVSFILLGLLLAAMARLTMEGFWILLGAYAVIVALAGFMNFLEDRKERAIAKLGSVYVLAPSERHWR